MTSDLPLFRATDPRSSRDAAERHVKSGRWGSEKRRVYDELCRQPGQTAAEIARNIGMVAYTVRKRLPDLRRDGLAQSTLQSGEVLRWWPVEDAAA